MNTLESVKSNWANGASTREEFWRAMQQQHLKLREYQRLIDGTQVAEIRILARELQVVVKDGPVLSWQPEDLRTAPNVLVNTGEYEPVEARMLASMAEGAGVVFDVGANMGFYALSWASKLAPGGKIHVFEPVPTTFERLIRNIEINDMGDRVIANNSGLADRVSTMTMYLPSFSGSGAASLADLHPAESSVEVQVPIGTLDEYMTIKDVRALDFMKVDVEGAELLVLKGGARSIAEHRPFLFLELLRKWSKPFGYHPNDVIKMLTELGYRCSALNGDRLRPFTEMTDATEQTNFFFAHPTRHQDWLNAHSLSD
jgi:FkbM family methyltransferase